MEKEIVEIPKEIYRNIKKIMKKENNDFTLEEYKQFTEIYKNSGEIQAKHI